MMSATPESRPRSGRSDRPTRWPAAARPAWPTRNRPGVADRFQPHVELELIEEPIKSWVTVQAGLELAVDAA